MISKELQKNDTSELNTTYSIFIESIDDLFHSTLCDINELSSADIVSLDGAFMELFSSVVNKSNVLIRALNDLFYDFNELAQQGTNIEEFKMDQIHILSVFKALQSAIINEDFIVLNDLLEHELKVTLVKWKKEMVPSIKKLNINQILS
jgi:hypothetical protein